MIRRAVQRDIPGLMQLLLQVDMVHHNARPDLFKGPATKYSETELSESLRDDDRPVFVYTDAADEKVLGHAFCVMQEHIGERVPTDIRTLYIDDICVDENARRQGIATALYETVTEYARQCGCYNVTLNVWVGNPDAQAFYEKCGMKPQKIGMETIL